MSDNKERGGERVIASHLAVRLVGPRLSGSINPQFGTIAPR
jgi:hypothetical protein